MISRSSSVNFILSTIRSAAASRSAFERDSDDVNPASSLSCCSSAGESSDAFLSRADARFALTRQDAEQNRASERPVNSFPHTAQNAIAVTPPRSYPYP